MASRDDATHARKTKTRRRPVAPLAGATGAFAAAAAMATGTAVTAAPAKADIDALIDPIIQPLITSLSDSIAGFDPAAATDLTSWADSLLASLNSFDAAAALPAAAEPAASPASGVYDIPLAMQEVTEPTVNVGVEGGSSVPMLVDTGSSGLVVPWYDVGQYGLGLFNLGLPSSIGESGYSGGIDYIYLVYNDATVNYGDGVLTTTNTPIDVEVLSWPTSFSPGSPLSFDQFLADDHVSGVLGIGDKADIGSGAASASPLEAAGFSGVTVDVPQGELVVGSNAGTPLDTLSGQPIPDNNLTEVVTAPGGAQIGSGPVSDDVDSGGVYGTIPSTIASTVAQGDKISVYDVNTLLYSYTVGTDSLGTNEAPTVFTGTAGEANPIDSGVEPYLEEPIYISYTGSDGAITFDAPGSGTA